MYEKVKPISLKRQLPAIARDIRKKKETRKGDAEEREVALDNYEPSLQTKIKTWKATLQEKETTLKELDEAIFELVSEDEILKEIETASTFTEQIKETIVIIDDKLKAETPQPWQAA